MSCPPLATWRVLEESHNPGMSEQKGAGRSLSKPSGALSASLPHSLYHCPIWPCLLSPGGSGLSAAAMVPLVYSLPAGVSPHLIRLVSAFKSLCLDGSHCLLMKSVFFICSVVLSTVWHPSTLLPTCHSPPSPVLLLFPGLLFVTAFMPGWVKCHLSCKIVLTFPFPSSRTV